MWPVTSVILGLMKMTTVPKEAPSPAPARSRTRKSAGQFTSPSGVFVSMALDMSWRLAVAVLAPIIGGYELDQHLHMTPLLTIVGFLLAMGGMAVVLMRMLQQVNTMTGETKVKKI